MKYKLKYKIETVCVASLSEIVLIESVHEISKLRMVLLDLVIPTHLLKFSGQHPAIAVYCTWLANVHC